MSGKTPTERQRVLQDYIERFRRQSAGSRAFLDYLKRSNVGIWRVERDPAPSKWWLYITLPENQQQIFELNREILVLYTDFSHLEPRSLSVIQSRARRDMRVEPDIAILISRDPRAKHTAARRAGEMAIIALNLEEIENGTSKLLHGHIAESVATVDHFDVSTPVSDPSGFFGRKVEIETITNDLKHAKSVGIFGLRKTGKTSLLNSIARIRSADAMNVTVRLDVSGIITAEQFRSTLLEGLWEAIHQLPVDGGHHPKLRTLTKKGLRRFDLDDSSTLWIQDIRIMLDGLDRPAVVMIDEIDQAYPPRSTLDEKEAGKLFQALVQLRSLIQEEDQLALLGAGVDPALFERPIVAGKDNLLYKLLRLVWLAPMNRNEMADMVRSLGKRMGVRIRGHEEIDTLFQAFGGHPLLTRKACSVAVRARTPETLPFHIDKNVLSIALLAREYSGPQSEAKDIITSFTEWFPNEAALMRLMYSEDGDEKALADELLAEDPDGMIHAVAYGLCFDDYSPRIQAAISELG